MTNREKLRKQITEKLAQDFFVRCLRLPVGTNVMSEAMKEADSILALPNLLVKAEDQKSECSIGHDSWCDYTPEDAYSTAKHDMLDAGFVKVEKP